MDRSDDRVRSRMDFSTSTPSSRKALNRGVGDKVPAAGTVVAACGRRSTVERSWLAGFGGTLDKMNHPVASAVQRRDGG